jgi:hypothetical protein
MLEINKAGKSDKKIVTVICTETDFIHLCQWRPVKIKKGNLAQYSSSVRIS